MGQSLTHPDCEIPYTVSSEYRHLVNQSTAGIGIAKDEGEIKYNSCDLIILYYYNLDKIEVKHIPLIKHTSDNFASRLRFSMPKGTKFKKGEVLYSYDCFRNGVPSFGYNVFTGYFNFFGLNHEDGLVISESFAQKAKAQYVETLVIPIYEYTMLQPIYQNIENSNVYFPNIGQYVKDGTVCLTVHPRMQESIYSSKDMKHQMMVLLKTHNISDLLNLSANNLSRFSVTPQKTKVVDGFVSGIKIHRNPNKKNTQLVCTQLQDKINEIRQQYIYGHVVPAIEELSVELGREYPQHIAQSHLCYLDKNPITNRQDLKDAVFLIEFEISAEKESVIGDKFCNRYANKGVVSFIIPDELRPMSSYTRKPIDLVFNPFSVFSRMNLSQLIEGIISKNIMYAEDYIKHDSTTSISDVLTWLNEDTIKHLNDYEYYNDVRQLITNIQNDEKLEETFKKDVVDNGLFIEAPAFSEVNTKEIYNNSAPPNEDVILSKELLNYLKQDLKISLPVVTQDVKLKNIFCAPIYIMKLCKVVDHIIWARDLGPVKYITKQPSKGRANEGGSRLGQMELEGILAHGMDTVLKEILTVKSDLPESKKDLLHQLISTGKYSFTENTKSTGGTQRVVDTLIKFVQD